MGKRLAPDMFTLKQQVQAACGQAKNATARLAGLEPPNHSKEEASISELKVRIMSIIAFMKTLDLRKIDKATERVPALHKNCPHAGQ